MSKILQGDCLSVLKILESESVDCCITSPPYWGLRDYGVDGQLGLEKTPEEYVAKMVEVFREVMRVLKDEGTLWLNLGDSYNGSGGAGYQFGDPKEPRIAHFNNPNCKYGGLKPKNLVGIPWRVAFALQSDGWYLRQDIIWHKPNPMPESVTDRCTKAHEYIFLMAKSQKYYFDNEAILEPFNCPERFERRYADPNSPKKIGCGSSKINEKTIEKSFEKMRKLGGRNKRSVWTITTKPFKGSHFATFPQDLIEPMIKAGCPQGGVCLDPFFGAGTTGVVCKKLGREYIGIELNAAYVKMAEARIQNTMGCLL